MFKTLFTLFLFVAAAFAQGAFIGLPTPGQTVVAGDDLTVQIQLPDTISEFTPVAVAIGLQSCSSTYPCSSPEYDMGTILFNGLFQPERYQTTLPPYENYTVSVPSSTPTGSAILGVAYFSLIGAGLAPTIQVMNQSLTIVS